MEALLLKFGSYVPSTTINIVQRLLDKRSNSVLDLGCGKGRPMKFLNRNHGFYAVGLDIFKPYLTEAKKDKTHDDYVLCDVRCMPVRDKSFDGVLAIEVLEHLDKNDGAKFLRNIERIARKEVIVTTPVYKCEQDICDKNPYQKHRCLWDLNELLSFGYIIKGVGLRGMFGKGGLAHRIPLFLRPVLDMLWIFAGILTYNKPLYASSMVCFKNLA